LLQFHGDEDQAFCESFGLPYMKAIQGQARHAQALEEIAAHSAAQKILLDKYVEHAPGGTGQTFDWGIAAELVEACDTPVVLAGGLNESNVVAAHRICATCRCRCELRRGAKSWHQEL
jgi:phosphoribosylanthranilate isomerase